MESKDIKRLIERYYDGATSREEEQAIADYFASHASSNEELEVERAIFLGLSRMRNEKAPVAIGDIKPLSRGLTTLWLGRVAAVAAVVVAALVLAGRAWQNPATELDYPRDIICYIDGEKITNNEHALSETSRLLGSVADNMTLAMASIEKYNPLTK